MSSPDADRRPVATFTRLPLGEITPQGWLRRQLRIQADGLTGHIDEVFPKIADSEWIGGETPGWEEGPYYADGLVPLAYLLEDDDLKAKAETWVEGFLQNQRDDGWIAPLTQIQNGEYDPWPAYVVLKVLRQYYEATGDEAVVDAMMSFCDRLQSLLAASPLDGWAKFRWQDLVVSVQWLYEQTEEEELLALAETAADQGFDWTSHLAVHPGRNEFQHTEPAPEWSHDSHVVNHAMGVKAPAVEYWLSGSEEHQQAASRALEVLDRYHGQATEVFTGDECLAGLSPTRGTELCAVVEYMFSLEQLTAVLGDSTFADTLERVAFNALPATLTPEMRAHQYDQQANQVLSTVAPREWLNGVNANLFEVHNTCCTANLHQGWPKFATSLWMRADDGLAAISYAPCEVSTAVDGVNVTLEQESSYPFTDTATLTITPDEPTEFGLHLRIPVWSQNPELHLPDDTRYPEPGTFHTVEREWSPGETVEVRLDPQVDAARGYRGSVALRRGPLVYSHSIAADRTSLAGRGPRSRALHPAEQWNHAVAIDADSPGDTVDHRFSEAGVVPFAPDDPPATMTVEGKPVPEWTLDRNVAGPVPRSPIVSEKPAETLTLVPYGCTNLRVTEFPLLADQ